MPWKPTIHGTQSANLLFIVKTGIQKMTRGFGRCYCGFLWHSFLQLKAEFMDLRVDCGSLLTRIWPTNLTFWPQWFPQWSWFRFLPVYGVLSFYERWKCSGSPGTFPNLHPNSKMCSFKLPCGLALLVFIPFEAATILFQLFIDFPQMAQLACWLELLDGRNDIEISR